MAQQIGTAEQNHLLQISSSLRIAYHRLSAFLSEAYEKSPSSVEPMQLGEEEENGEAKTSCCYCMLCTETAEKERDSTVAKVEEKMRECFIRNKRAKRPPSSAMVESSTAEERSGRDYGFDLGPNFK